MVPWADFATARPDLAAAGRELFYQDFGVGLGFLATTTRVGSPRVHPICPAVGEGMLYAFIVPSPKLQDLMKDGRYALHSELTPRNEDAFYVTGRIRVIDNPEVRRKLEEAYVAERPNLSFSDSVTGEIREGLLAEHLEGQTAVEFLIETCLLTRTKGHGDFKPQHTVWKASMPP